jgi:pyrroloquinoline quinone biosynthesis protein B
MLIKILGSAAGGGFPQWNCGCNNCEGVRSSRILARPRTQSQVTVSSDNINWHLLNASPDLRQQIQSDPQLQPGNHELRNSPIRSVLLTNADIDHTLGLLLLRESQPLRVYATDFVRGLIKERNAYFRMLEQFSGQTEWQTLTSHSFVDLSGRDDKFSSDLTAQIHSLGGKPPFWAQNARQEEDIFATIGVVLADKKTGGRLGFFPGVKEIDEPLLDILKTCDVILFDGTFWDDEEMPRLQPGSRTARQMQHIPISGPGGSLDLLSKLPVGIRKIYTHINNTNPILNEDSAEHRWIQGEGWEIATDGLEITL